MFQRKLCNLHDLDFSDNLLTCKRKDHDIQDGNDDVSTEEPLEAAPKAKGRVITKAALAKKILKKNFKVNEKIKFDEDGEVLESGSSQKMSLEGKDYETTEDTEFSGIDIARARDVIKAEDVFDKAKEKDRVKEKRKEKKRKEKEAKKRKREEDKEEVESEADIEDSEDNDGDEPNLDWLPDPDKIYSDREDDPDEGSSSGAEDEEELERRKWKPPKKAKASAGPKRPRMMLEESEEEEDAAEGLADDEELALQLLKHK